LYAIDLSEAEITGGSKTGLPKTLTVSIEKCDPRNLELQCLPES
jgi:hypothetical protein